MGGLKALSPTKKHTSPQTWAMKAGSGSEG